MCGLIAMLLVILGGFLGVTAVENQPLFAQRTGEVTPTPISTCAAPTSDQDLSDMLALVGTTFEPEIWTRQTSGDSTRTTVTWTALSLGATASLTYLHSDCGVTQGQLDDYFDADSFETMFSNYLSYKQTAMCHRDDPSLNLYQFDALFSGYDYHALLWGEQVSPTRIAGFMLIFPSEDRATQADYAKHLFPHLTTCTP
ncbi:MAG: hypothetical protein ABI700_16215 [Chloroflexota bacterium]